MHAYQYHKRPETVAIVTWRYIRCLLLVTTWLNIFLWWRAFTFLIYLCIWTFHDLISLIQLSFITISSRAINYKNKCFPRSKRNKTQNLLWWALCPWEETTSCYQRLCSFRHLYSFYSSYGPLRIHPLVNVNKEKLTNYRFTDTGQDHIMKWETQGWLGGFNSDHQL